MAIDLQHDGPSKFALAGLDLNAPVDLVPPTKYSRATNVVSKIEGRMEGRDGTLRISAIVPNTPIHTIFRLAQFVSGINGERLVGAGTTLFTAPLPAGNSFTPLTGPSFDGGPLSILQFRFDGDPGGAWAIIANSAGMMKRRAGYYQQLGVPAPTVPAQVSAGGAGLLDSSSGTGYDWLYTYLNEVTLSESNPSPPTLSPGGSLTAKPSAFTNPDVVGNVAFANPANAFDGSSATSAHLSVQASTNGGNVHRSGGCIWRGVPFNPSQFSQIVLNITSQVVVSAVRPVDGDGVPIPGAFVSAGTTIQYSLDGGSTWITVYAGGSRAETTDSVTLPNGTNLANVQVRSNGNANANMPTGTGFTATATCDIDIYDITVTLTLLAGQPGLLNLVGQKANLCVGTPTDPQETAIRLYRRGGTLPNNYFQVGQYPISSLVQGPCGAGLLQVVDNVPDSQVQLGPIAPIDNFMPVSSVQATNFPLPVIFGPYDERVLGCGDPARPESVYFSIRGNADIWPAENWVVVANPGEQMMNGIVYSLRCFAFSRERLFILLPNIIAGVTFTPSETACRRGLKGRWALAAGEQGVYFVAKDGVYRTQGGPEQSVIDDSIRPLFPVREGTVGTPTNGYDAVDTSDENGLRLVFHNSEIWFFYTGLTTQTRQLLIYDERRSRWRAGTYADSLNIVYSEPNTSSSLLFGATDGDLYQVGGGVDGENSVPIPVNFRTGALDQGRPLNLKQYQHVVLDIDPGGATVGSPVVVTPLINGETVVEAAINVSGSGRQRVDLPLNQSGIEIYGYNIEFDFAWNGTNAIRPVAYQYEILYRHEPAELLHWELSPSSFGMEGFLHVRDIYVMLRSAASVTLTVFADDIASPLIAAVLPATSGLKDKLYVQLPPNKAKLYSFTLDSSQPFRIYADESEVRIKQLLTKLGYQNVPVLGREQVGRPFGLTNV